MTEGSGRRRRILLISVAVVVVLGLVTAVQAVLVKSSLEGARADLRSMVDLLDEGDQDGAVKAAVDADDAAGSADWHTHTPVWWVSQWMPFVGDDVKAVRTVSDSVHALTSDVVSPLVEAGLTPNQFKPRAGRFDLEPLRQARAILEDAAPAVAGAERDTTQLETSGLLAPVKRPVEELQSMLRGATRVSRAAAIATQLLPTMLGGDEDRTYLLVFQNNAETRALGGMPGSIVALTATDGRLELGRSYTPGDFHGNTAVTPIEDHERALFDMRLVVSARPTFTPDFPRAAEIFQAFWERSGRPPVDGVISVDPVALSYLIDYTGPIGLEDGTRLTRDNTVQVLLRDAYQRFDYKEQDKFFADAARTIFDTVIQTSGSVQGLVDALTESIDERRIAVWSAHPEEQEQLAGEDVANELPQDTGRPELGFYINGDKGDKLGYYLRSDLSVSATCTDDRQLLEVEVEMRSTAPRRGLDDYVYGAKLPGLPRAAMRNRVYLYAPSGAEITDAELVGGDVDFTRVQHGTRPVAYAKVDLPPGEPVTLRYSVEAEAGQDGDVRVLTTPLADGTGGEAYVETGC